MGANAEIDKLVRTEHRCVQTRRTEGRFLASGDERNDFRDGNISGYLKKLSFVPKKSPKVVCLVALYPGMKLFSGQVVLVYFRAFSSKRTGS